MKVIPVIIIAVMALTLGAMRCPSQTMQSGIGPSMPMAGAASYYYISKPGELTMQVNIWGAIKNPGRYEIPSSTGLVELVSYAGGPSSEAKLSEVHIVRAPGADSTADRGQLTVDLDHLASVKPSQLVLHPGDTIFIDRSGWSSFRDVLTVVTTAALLSTAVANIIIAERR